MNDPTSPKSLRTLENSEDSSQEYRLVKRKPSIPTNQKAVQTLDMYYSTDSTPEDRDSSHTRKDESAYKLPVTRILCPNPLFEFTLKDKHLSQAEENQIIKGLFEGSSIREINIERVVASPRFLADLMSSAVHLEKLQVFKLSTKNITDKSDTQGNSSIKTLGASPKRTPNNKNSSNSTQRSPGKNSGWVAADLSGKELREVEIRGCCVESLGKISKHLQILNLTDSSLTQTALQQLSKCWKGSGLSLNITRLAVSDQSDPSKLVCAVVRDVLCNNPKIKRIYTSIVLDSLDPKCAEGLATALISNCSVEYFGFAQQSKPLQPYSADPQTQVGGQPNQNVSGWNWSLTGVSPIYGGDWNKFLQRIVLANRFLLREASTVSQLQRDTQLTQEDLQSLLSRVQAKMNNFGLSPEVQAIVMDKLKIRGDQQADRCAGEGVSGGRAQASRQTGLWMGQGCDEEEQSLLREIAERQLLDHESSPMISKILPKRQIPDLVLKSNKSKKKLEVNHSDTSRIARELNQSEEERQLRCIRELELATRSGDRTDRKMENDLNQAVSREVRMDLANYTEEKGYYDDYDEDFQTNLRMRADSDEIKRYKSREPKMRNPSSKQLKKVLKSRDDSQKQRQQYHIASKNSRSKSAKMIKPKLSKQDSRELSVGKVHSVLNQRSKQDSLVKVSEVLDKEPKSLTPIAIKKIGIPRNYSPLQVRKKLDMDSRQEPNSMFVKIHQSIMNMGQAGRVVANAGIQHHRIKSELSIKDRPKSTRSRSGSPKAQSTSKSKKKQVTPRKVAKPTQALGMQDKILKIDGWKPAEHKLPKLMTPPSCLLPQFTLGAHLPQKLMALGHKNERPRIDAVSMGQNLLQKKAGKKSKTPKPRTPGDKSKKKSARPKKTQPGHMQTNRAQQGVETNKENEGWRANQQSQIQQGQQVQPQVWKKQQGAQTGGVEKRVCVNERETPVRERRGEGFDDARVIREITGQGILLTTDKHGRDTGDKGGRRGGGERA